MVNDKLTEIIIKLAASLVNFATDLTITNGKKGNRQIY